MNNQLIIATPAETSERQLILSALSDTSVSKSTMESLAEAVSAAIEKGCFYLGLNKSQTDKDAMKLIVMEDCQRSFKSLTLSEIKLAINQGVKGEYGEVRGMAPKDVFHWINSYKNNQLRIEAIKEVNKDDINRTPTEDEEVLMALQALDIAWRTFKETGSYIDHGNTIYNILDNNHKFSFTKEEKKSFMAAAKSRMLDYYAPEKHLGNDIKMKEMMAIYAQVKQEDSNIRVIGEAKRIALTRFFESLLASGKDIWDLFK